MTEDQRVSMGVVSSEEELAAVLAALGVGAEVSAAGEPADGASAWRVRRLKALGLARRPGFTVPGQI
jgi:hypothetical protein